MSNAKAPVVERKEPSPTMFFQKSWAELDEEEDIDPTIFEYDESPLYAAELNADLQEDAKKLPAWGGSLPTSIMNPQTSKTHQPWRPSKDREAMQRSERPIHAKKNPSPSNITSKPLRRGSADQQKTANTQESPQRSWRASQEGEHSPQPLSYAKVARASIETTPQSAAKSQIQDPAGLSPSDDGKSPEKAEPKGEDVPRKLDFSSRAFSCDAIAEALIATPLKAMDERGAHTPPNNHTVAEVMVSAPIPYKLRSSCSGSPSCIATQPTVALATAPTMLRQQQIVTSLMEMNWGT